MNWLNGKNVYCFRLNDPGFAGTFGDRKLNISGIYK